MRTLELSNGKTLEINPMTIGQAKKLFAKKDGGLEPLFFAAEIVDPKGEFTNDLPATELGKIFKEVLAESFGSEEETKN